MSSTNQTSNYQLPLFIGTDKPTWLGDFNGAMNKIDTSIKGVSDVASSNTASIGSMQEDVDSLETQVGTLENTVQSHTTSIVSLTQTTNSLVSDVEDLQDSKSYVGMIIHSTTLDTMDKVKAFYGGTTWIKHEGYFLRGASSGVTPNSATASGGNDDAIVPYHRHTVSAVSGAITGGNHHHLVTTFGSSGGQGSGTAGAWVGTQSANTEDATHTHDLPQHNTDYVGTSGNTTNANIPRYKSVYIWERTA